MSQTPHPRIKRSQIYIFSRPSMIGVVIIKFSSSLSHASPKTYRISIPNSPPASLFKDDSSPSYTLPDKARVCTQLSCQQIIMWEIFSFDHVTN